MSSSLATDLQSRCDLMRSLHRSDTPLPLPNAWDVAGKRAQEELVERGPVPWSIVPSGARDERP